MCGWPADRGPCRWMISCCDPLASLSLEQQVVLGVGPNPDPQQEIVSGFNREGSVTQADPDGPEATNLLEVQGRMAVVSLELLVGPIGLLLDGLGECVVAAPEPWAGGMFQRSVQRPESRSAKASSASQSRAPDVTSCSSCRSQSAASNCSNQALNRARSEGASA